MAEKDSLVSLRDIFPADDELINTMLDEDAYIICANKRGRKNRFIPFKVMYNSDKQFWTQDDDWDYFLTAETFSDIKNKADVLRSKMRTAGAAPRAEQRDNEEDLGKDYKAVAAMTPAQRVEHISKNRKRLDDLISKKTPDAQTVATALVDAAGDTALINHTSLKDAMRLTDNEARKYTQSLVDSTRDLVKTSTELISRAFDDELMNTLVEKSNGTIIQHMTRVYLNGTAFLLYYNNLISASSYINKLRVFFERKYKNFYLPLLPHTDPSDFTLERVFYGGMRAIPDDCFLNWTVGFLIHDVGKAAAVEYHEGEAAYSRDIVVEHVKTGYDSIMNKTNYPRDAGYITGYHHEYYGDSAGYGYYRAALELHKKMNSSVRQTDYCIAYDIEPVLNYEALAFFPAKVLEIIDVYDSVTDPNRKYRKPLSSEGALAMMRSEFIEKHRKIDVILFDTFVSFIREKAQKRLCGDADFRVYHAV